MKILVISDLHLNDGSGADDFGDNDLRLISWLCSFRYDMLVLNGDIYELWQSRKKKIRQAHKALFYYLETMLSAQLIQLKGNHDYRLFKLLSKVIKTKSGKRILITHGFQNDPWMTSPVSRFLVWCVGIIEKPIPGIDNIWGTSKKISNKTFSYAMKMCKKYDYVVCGHTHILREGKSYFNSGTCQQGRLEGVLIDTDTDEIRTIKK